MPYLAEEHVSIPTMDILSWMYDDPRFEQEMPVCIRHSRRFHYSCTQLTQSQIYIDALDPSHYVTAAQAKVFICKLIAGFRHAGIKRGDVVLVHAFNSIYYPIIVLGIVGAGAIYTGTNPGYTAHEMTHALKSTGAKMIICDPDVLGDTVTAAAQACGLPLSKILTLDTALSLPAILTRFNDDGTHASWRTLLQHGSSDWLHFDNEKTSRDTVAGLFFSSGTTGLPKLVQLSHYNLIAQHTLVFEHNPRPYILKRLIALPMFHAATAPSTHFSPLRAGHQQVVMRRYEPRVYLEMCEKHRITELTLVPPVVTSILAFSIPEESKKRMLFSVRWAWCGAAYLSAHTQALFQALLPSGSSVTQVWGMTEVSCFGSLLPFPQTDSTGSVGRFVPNTDIKLLDDDDNDITDFDVRGELAIRGPTVTQGYAGVPRERDFDTEGYFRTGDILYCDGKTGLWYIIDRKKELIKVRGFQVAPAELEGALLEHPDIADVAVLGVTIGEEELPRAFVVKRDAALSEADVKSWVEGKLARYKRLDGGVRFVDVIPKSPSGKILKKVLREQEDKVDRAKL
jgi:4-coumarate--CoA ligase